MPTFIAMQPGDALPSLLIPSLKLSRSLRRSPWPMRPGTLRRPSSHPRMGRCPLITRPHACTRTRNLHRCFARSPIFVGANGGSHLSGRTRADTLILYRHLGARHPCKHHLQAQRPLPTRRPLRRSACIAECEAPFYVPMATKASWAKAAKFNLSKASIDLAAAVLGSSLCDSDEQDSDMDEAPDRLAQIALICGADADEADAIRAAGALPSP